MPGSDVRGLKSASPQLQRLQHLLKRRTQRFKVLVRRDRHDIQESAVPAHDCDQPVALLTGASALVPQGRISDQIHRLSRHSIHPNILVVPDLPQIGIGLAQRSQQIVRRLIEAGIRVLRLVAY